MDDDDSVLQGVALVVIIQNNSGFLFLYLNLHIFINLSVASLLTTGGKKKQNLVFHFYPLTVYKIKIQRETFK